MNTKYYKIKFSKQDGHKFEISIEAKDQVKAWEMVFDMLLNRVKIHDLKGLTLKECSFKKGVK